MKRHVFYKQRNGGVWRKARTVHRCDWKHSGYRCGHHIQPDDQYFDTKQPNPASSNIHGTFRICADCANQEILV